MRYSLTDRDHCQPVRRPVEVGTNSGGLCRFGSDAVLDQAIIEAIARKPERHLFNDQPEKVVRIMSLTGG